MLKIEQLSNWQGALERAIDERVAVLQHSPGVYTAITDGGVYRVEAHRAHDEVAVTCTCPAGEHVARCKHAAAALVAEGIIELELVAALGGIP